ncbi:MAG: cytochrome c-type biogenesis protein CcmH [Betaproteobacteria bacterium]|nr:cytochrome c-type biogenesis protein CcmH [Betaproteobacteria bacterium]
MQWSRLLVCCMLLFSGAVMAKEAAPMAADLEVEKRMVAISEELRCLVCQNESLSGSHAELAQDLRREIRTMIGQGKTDKEILDFMVARYGDFVRYRPPVKPTTWLLWGGPFLLMAGGIAALIFFLRRRAKDNAAPALSEEEHRRAAALLEQPNAHGSKSHP